MFLRVSESATRVEERLFMEKRKADAMFAGISIKRSPQNSRVGVEIDEKTFNAMFSERIEDMKHHRPAGHRQEGLGVMQGQRAQSLSDSGTKNKREFRPGVAHGKVIS